MPPDDVDVTLYTGNKEIRTMSRKNQFKNKTFIDISESPEYIKYFEICKNIPPPEVETVEGFYNWLDNRNRHFEEEVKDNGAKVYEVMHEILSHVWLSDDKEAIFSFYNDGNNSNEVSFYTHDKRIIEILSRIIKNTKLKDVRE
jgi:hypothetical protein